MRLLHLFPLTSARKLRKTTLSRFARGALILAISFLLLGTFVFLNSGQAEAQPSNNANLSNLEWRVAGNPNFGWGVTDRWNRPIPGTDLRNARPGGIAKFSASKTTYRQNLSEAYSYVRVRATAENSSSTIEIGKGSDLRTTASGARSHAMKLDRGRWNTINVKVTAADGVTTKTYVTYIVRKNRAIPYLNGSGVSCCTSGRTINTVEEGDSVTLTLKLLSPTADDISFGLYYRSKSWWYPDDAEDSDYTSGTMTRTIYRGEETDTRKGPDLTILRGESSGSVTIQTNEDDDKTTDIFRVAISDLPLINVTMWPIHEYVEIIILDNDGPNAPRNLQVAADSDELRLSWKAPTGSTPPGDWYGSPRQPSLTGYEVQYKERSAPDARGASGDPSTGWTVAARDIGYKHTYTIRHVKPATAYDVRVRGLNRSVAGAWATTQDTTPSGSQAEGSRGTESALGALPRPLTPPEQEQPQLQQASPQNERADLIAQMYEWRNDPQWSSYKAHTDRWDRALLAFGETVSDTTLTPLTAAEAQGYADRGSAWHRWVPVAAALKEIESGGQQQDPPPQQQDTPTPETTPTATPTPTPTPEPNRAPTVANGIDDATIVSESGTRAVSLSGVFSDADNDALTITAASSNDAVATASVASGGSGLTVNAQSRGTATITVTADDGSGGTVSDTFTARVKAAPTVASSLADVSGLEAGTTLDVSLSGAFSDADGDALTITAASSDDAKATVTVAAGQSRLTVAGVSEGTATITVTARDSDGNRASDAFDVSVSWPDSPLSGSAGRYDANGDGRIDPSEYRQAARDYADEKISYAEMLEVVRAYLAS